MATKYNPFPPLFYLYDLTPNDDTLVVTTTNARFGNFIFAGAGEDAIYGSNGRDEVWGGSEDDRLYGNGGNDVLLGEDGNDTLDGGAAADTMLGGTGDDNYYVDDAGDVVTRTRVKAFLTPCIPRSAITCPRMLSPWF